MRIFNFFTPKKKPEIDYIVISRVEPSYYGLCGRRLVKRKITDRCLCIDLYHGIGNPDTNGWDIDCIQYK